MEQVAEKINEDVQLEQAAIDFKMVTFTLAGRDYAIDIMKVKEISKVSKFTFVPNASPYVRGVYNLRGDIISVIDLRVFFHLPVEDYDGKADAENVIILRLEDHVLAVIVDEIDKVVGISKEAVQPPHPIFGDINIKYIRGVAEDNGRLYVILDVERILGSGDKTEKSSDAVSASVAGKGLNKAVTGSASASYERQDDVALGFIEETLVTFLSFYSSPLNSRWIRSRYNTWKSQRGADVQLTSEKDAKDYLTPFWSPYTGSFWSAEYSEKIASLLPEGHKGNFNVWNPGCGIGHETYSIACTIKKALPQVNLKIIAYDNDLIRISAAPGLKPEKTMEEPLNSFISRGARESAFQKEITDSILFEYHDITHDNTLPRLDMVVARDTLSFLPPDSCAAVFTVFEEVMKPGALLILGNFEEPLNPDSWERVALSGIVAYKKK